MKCAYRKYYIVCIITVSHSEVCADLAQNASATQYLYENAKWSDVLTGVKKSHYEGSTEVVDEQYSVSSDEIGNTTDYKGSTYTWVGRQLRSITDSDNSSTTYSYNSDGQRISKIVNTADGKMYNYRYYYNGDILAGFILYATESGSMTYVGQIRFMYDESGEAFGIDINGKEYFYVKNAQNDVVRIVDSANETVVNYQYDSWGKLLSCEDTSENDIVSFINPYTYRGYYYEIETNSYFLKSRYYNPELCRFISADSVVSGTGGEILGYNMFAYCMNNPIKNSDDNGNWPKWATKVLIGVGAIALGALVAAATVATGGATAAFVGAMATGLKAAVISGAIGAVTGAGKQAIKHRRSTGSWRGSKKKIINGAVNGFANGFMTGGIMSGASQVLSSGFKIIANAGVKTGRNGGLSVGDNFRFLSPNHPNGYETGGTILKFGSKYSNLRFDVGSKSLFHMNVQFSKNANYHVPIGILGSGLSGGLEDD